MYWLKIVLFSILDSEDINSNNYIIARYLLENYNSLPGVSLTEISRQCNLSKAAVSRFCKDIGLMDYIDLQMLIRSAGSKEEKQQQRSVIEQKADYFTWVESAYGNLKKAVEAAAVEELITDLARYDSILLFGHLQASHIAYTLGNNLAMSDKICWCRQSWAEQTQKLKEAGPNDLIVVFSASGDYFHRMDINMSFLAKPNAPKAYLITFDGAPVSANDHLRIISLGPKPGGIPSNITMNLFMNYISVRVRETVSFRET